MFHELNIPEESGVKTVLISRFIFRKREGIHNLICSRSNLGFYKSISSTSCTYYLHVLWIFTLLNVLYMLYFIK